MTNQPKSDYEIASSIAALRSTYVVTGRDEMFRKHLDRLLRRDEGGNLLPEPVRFTAQSETRGIVLIDGPGGGKTSLVSRALRNHPAMQGPSEGDMTPFLDVTVPNPATLKSLGLEVLRQSDYPAISERSERWSIWNRVRHRLRLLGTTVLWIDEAHDIFRSNAQAEIEDILKTLKSLMQGDGSVIVILTGTKTLGQIANSDEQVRRRFSKIRLQSVSETADGECVWATIYRFCQKVQIAAPERADLIGRLMHGSRYRFGRCIEGIINAIENALQNGDRALDLQHFAETYAMQEGCELAENVFLVSGWQKIELSDDDASPVARKKRAA